LFPFYYWLPEVHCEANTSISLLLAGLLLKLSIYGFIRFILNSFFITLRFLSSIIISLSLIGIVIITCSCFRYFDLKKIIALSSIIHLSTSFISIFSLNYAGIIANLIISLSHSLSSISLFLLSGLLINKTYSRFLDSFYFINSKLKSILLLLILSNLSFPGSINFISELFILISLLCIDYFFLLFYLILLFIITFIWFLIYNKKLPYHSCYSLFIIHYLFFIIISFIIYYLGIIYLLIDYLQLNYVFL
jgi:NADH-quinone oxidoreductase subunit M